jgi:hypothetical protein
MHLGRLKALELIYLVAVTYFAVPVREMRSGVHVGPLSAFIVNACQGHGKTSFVKIIYPW